MEEKKSLKYVGIIFFILLALVLIGKFGSKKEELNQNENPNSHQYEDENTNQYDYSKPLNLSLSVQEIKRQAILISYEELYRYNESYLHKIIHIKGQIVQTFQTSGYTTGFRIATKGGYYGYYDNIIYVDYDEYTRLMDNDYIEVWGEVMGLLTYTTVMGSELTIPHLYSLHSVLLNVK